MIDIDTIKRADKFKVFSWVYVVLGLLIVLYPPQYKRLSYESKFCFFAYIDKIDFYFFTYEVISYILIGSVVYFLFFKDRRKREMTLEEKETEALKHGGV